MYEYLIKEYVNKLTQKDIINFANSKNIPLNEKDAQILLYYISNHYQELISNNPTYILKEIKKKIDPITYNEAYKLFLYYRNEYLFKKYP